MRQEGRSGGPTDPTTGFSEAFLIVLNPEIYEKKYESFETHPLYESL